MIIVDKNIFYLFDTKGDEPKLKLFIKEKYSLEKFNENFMILLNNKNKRFIFDLHRETPFLLQKIECKLKEYPLVSKEYFAYVNEERCIVIINLGDMKEI